MAVRYIVLISKFSAEYMFLTIYTCTNYQKNNNFFLFYSTQNVKSFTFQVTIALLNLLTDGLFKTLKYKCNRTQKDDNIERTVNTFGKPYLEKLLHFMRGNMFWYKGIVQIV